MNEIRVWWIPGRNRALRGLTLNRRFFSVYDNQLRHRFLGVRTRFRGQLIGCLFWLSPTFADSRNFFQTDVEIARIKWYNEQCSVGPIAQRIEHSFPKRGVGSSILLRAVISIKKRTSDNLLICRKFFFLRSIFFSFQGGCRKLNMHFFSNRRLIRGTSTVQRPSFDVQQTDSGCGNCSSYFTLRSTDTNQ